MSKLEFEQKEGYISEINGSIIKVKGIETKVRLHDLVKIKRHNILGEVIQIYSEYIVAQCYEHTYNVKLHEKVVNLQEPLSMELGPGLLGNIFDGIQRPLDEALSKSDLKGFLDRGLELNSLSRTKKWKFTPLKRIGDFVKMGDIIGIVKETPSIDHKIMVPPNISGKIEYISKEGNYKISEVTYRLSRDSEVKSFNMIQKWPVIDSRPYERKIPLSEPLLTGLRVIDLLFPVAKGGTVAVPGGFGTGKTIIQQSLAKWCDADVIVFVGCGERGNEIADVLEQFSKLIDPRSQRPLLERIVLIANTSNMPVSAREASIFSGITIAEYYRDMGYDVALLADSTSRWAESLREISGLLEEMPAEEGYPAYLPSKLSSFYERSGVVKPFTSDEEGDEIYGSLTIIGSVSPPSGDFSEPVTSNTKRFVQTFWALDANLAYSKHYPAINWRESYSNYPEYLSDWWQKRDLVWSEINVDWFEARKEINELLSNEHDLLNITQLIGEENLPDEQQLILFICRIIKNGFLIQNAFDDIDCYTDTVKLLGQIKLILLLYYEGKELLKQGFLMDDVRRLGIVNDLMRISTSVPNNNLTELDSIKRKLYNEFESLKSIFGRERM